MLGMQFGVVTLGTLLRQAKLTFLQTLFAKCRSFSTKSCSSVYGSRYLKLGSITAAIRKRVSYVRLRKGTKSGNKINLKYSWHIEDLKAISAHA